MHVALYLREEPVEVPGVVDLSHGAPAVRVSIDSGLSQSTGHDKVGDGGNGIDEEGGDVEGSVSVGDLLGQGGEAEEAGGHDAEHDP